MKIALIIIISILVSFIAAIIGILIWARRHVKIERVAKQPQEKVLYENVKGGMIISIIDDDEESYDVLNTMMLSSHNAVIIYHNVHRKDVIEIFKKHPLMAEYEDIEEWSDENLEAFLPAMYAEKTNIIEYKIGDIIMYSLDISNSDIKILEEGESFYDVF